MRVYKKYIILMLIISLILPNTMFLTTFAENEIIITTGQEFAEKISAGNTFKIEGNEDTNGDGIPDGIIIPNTYQSFEGFNGTIIGVDGKNNIQISKPLFNSFSGTTTIENINLKTDNEGTFTAGTVDGYGALVCVINTDGTYTFNKVANYCDISSDISTSYASLGGLIGKVTKGTLNLSLCSNYGSVTTSKRYVGGLIGYLSGDITFTIDKSFNAGNITGDRNTAGIAGLVTVTSGTISNSFNAGNVVTSTSNAANGGAGIAAPGTKCLTVNNVYNVGALSHSGGQAARVYGIAYEPRVVSSENCYYITDSNATGSTVGTEITVNNLSSQLPDGFSSDCWEFVMDDGIDSEYKYPQIKGNTLWNDYKYIGTNDNAILESSLEPGTINIVSTGWEKVNSATGNTSVYKDIVSPSGYDISTLASYGGVLGLSRLIADKDSKSECTFTINKSAEVYIATDKNPKEETVDVVKDNGFKQVFNSDGETPATVVTKGGAIFYLSKKSYVVSGNESTKDVAITGDTSGLDKSYFVFVNWLDNSTVSFDLSGNENIYINDELYQNSTYSTAKGGTFKIKIEPKQNYYIKDLLVDGESEQQNIVTYYEKEIDAVGDITIKSETSLYEFIDEDLTDDIIPPTYQLIQEIENGTGLTIQSVKAEGYLGEFLEGATVTLNIKKDGTPVTSAQGTVNGYGKVQITASVGNTEGDCTLSFTINILGNENDIYLDDSKKTFKVPSVADVNNLITNINNSQITAGDLTALILEERDTLAFKTNVFKELDPAIQNKIASDILASNDYNVSNVYTRFDNFVIMNTLNMTKDKEDILRLLDTYVLETWIDFSQIYDDYVLSDDKLRVCEYMIGVEYSDISYVLPQFEYAYVKSQLKNVVSYDQILSTLDNGYDTLLQIESLIATALSKDINEQKVINEGIGTTLNELTTKALFKDKLNYLVTNSSTLAQDKINSQLPPVILPPQLPGNTGGGGGGGSVSVGNDYVETPVVTPVESGGTDAFTDLSDVKWAGDSINKLFYKGIIKGKEQGKFCPNDKVTRAEFVKMAVEAFNLEIENPVSDFTDLPKDHWAYRYVASASDIGIINGYSATEFGTEGSISRQDVIAILIRIIYRLAKYEEMENRKNPGVSFADESEIADYALGGVTMFAGSGIISGYEDGSFRPTQDLTRAEAAVILNNVIEFFRI